MTDWSETTWSLAFIDYYTAIYVSSVINNLCQWHDWESKGLIRMNFYISHKHDNRKIPKIINLFLGMSNMSLKFLYRA